VLGRVRVCSCVVARACCWLLVAGFNYSNSLSDGSPRTSTSARARALLVPAEYTSRCASARCMDFLAGEHNKLVRHKTSEETKQENKRLRLMVKRNNKTDTGEMDIRTKRAQSY
jgi:hypothetical protein